jgi:hypothetical protein
VEQPFDVVLIFKQLSVPANDLITEQEAQQRLKEEQDLATDKAKGFIGFQKEDSRCNKSPTGNLLRQPLNEEVPLVYTQLHDLPHILTY